MVRKVIAYVEYVGDPFWCISPSGLATGRWLAQGRFAAIRARFSFQNTVPGLHIMSGVDM
jgi:hypothetical protein